MKILALDPSGAYNVGKGMTGYYVVDEEGEFLEFGTIDARNYKHRIDYWKAHIELIDELRPNEVVMESYRIYGHKAKAQIGSEMETSQLIGEITFACEKNGIKLTMQQASQVKRRWTDLILMRCGYLDEKGGKYYVKGTVVNRHVRDAIRHALHYVKYTRKRMSSK